MTRWLRWAAALALLVTGCNSGWREVAGSTCDSDQACDDYPSCAWRADGCECRSGVCYLDPDSSYDEALGCRGCHGSLANAAPPTSLDGETDTTSIGVGAHQSHLEPRGMARVVACSSCHVVPETVNAEGHIDDSPPAEVVFDDLATADGSFEARWDRESGTCVNYCHGATLDGGSNTTPTWTVVGQGESACGTCHGLPPGGVHPNDDGCERCHAPTAGPNQSIANASTHIDGILQVTGGHCDTCHGDSSRPAPLNASPPTDLAGNQESDQVGAHLAHLMPTMGADVACAACHVVPQSVGDPGHVDDTDATAEVTFSGRAIAAGGPSPSYDPATLRCTNTYCHGVTVAGGTNGNQTSWPGAGPFCDSCHGTPPPTPAHDAVTENDPCGDCHPDSSSSSSPLTISNRTFHIDGTVQVAGCGDSCHDVPPDSGAHGMHAGTMGFECKTCHGHNGSGPTHDNGTLNVPFDSTVGFPGGTTIGNGSSPSYDSATKSCRVGCHNPVIGNPDETPNLNNHPVWTAGAQNCRACHDQISAAPPGNHQIAANDRADCQVCHDVSSHTLGTVVLRDQDPTDSYVPVLGTIDPLCKGCHDGGGGTFFGASPRNVMAGWNASSHGGEGMHCNDCHTYHVSTNNTTQSFVDRGVDRCIGSGCHDDLYQSPDGPFTFAGSHHPVDETVPDKLRCVSCHNPHLAQPSPLAASDPDNKWTLYSNPTVAASRKRTATGGVDTRGFCLACHDGNPPAGVPSTAMNMSGGSDPSQFKEEGESLHQNKHSGWNCVTCHDGHGAEGTTGINRGRTLAPFIRVNNFPYTGKSSCSTPSQSSGSLGRIINGTWVNYSFGCH